ncbi:sporulation protein YjcZ [Paenibacillus sp. BR2-3]
MSDHCCHGPAPVPVHGVFWTSTGIILVLYILLVIILRAGMF